MVDCCIVLKPSHSFDRWFQLNSCMRQVEKKAHREWSLNQHELEVIKISFVFTSALAVRFGLTFTPVIFMFKFLCRTILDMTFLHLLFLDILTTSNFSRSLHPIYHSYFLPQIFTLIFYLSTFHFIDLSCWCHEMTEGKLSGVWLWTRLQQIRE